MTPIGRCRGQADSDVKDRFGGQSGDGGGADVFDGGASSSRPGSPQLHHQPLERLRPAGVAGDPPDLAVGQAEVSAAEPVAHGMSVRIHMLEAATFDRGGVHTSWC